MKLRDMKMGDVGIIEIDGEKYIVMRNYAMFPSENDRKIALYILGSDSGKVCSGDAFDFNFYENNMDMELLKVLTLKFDPSIFD